jgi:hypothetical protein
MPHSRIELREGWSMKEVDGEEWLPVRKVPSQVHVDLLANKMYVCVPHIAIHRLPPAQKHPTPRLDSKS